MSNVYLIKDISGVNHRILHATLSFNTARNLFKQERTKVYVEQIEKGVPEKEAWDVVNVHFKVEEIPLVSPFRLKDSP